MSSSFEFGFPDVGFDKDDQEFYESLVKSDSPSPFRGMTRADVFIYAMAVGFKENLRRPIPKGNRTPNMPPEAFKPEMRWLMRALVIMVEKNLEGIIEHRKVVSIAEEYANGGISLVKEYVKSGSLDEDPEAFLETNLRKLLA